MAKATLYLITGVNGSGKSTIRPLLRKRLSAKFAVHDIDEFGVPANVDEKWRQKQTRHWMAIAKKNSKQNIKTVLCGLTVPEEVYDILKDKTGIKVKICLLDVSASKIEQRLKKRYSTPARVKNLKQVTGATVPENILANINHAKILRQQCKQHKCKVFNTSRPSINKTADQIASWLET